MEPFKTENIVQTYKFLTFLGDMGGILEAFTIFSVFIGNFLSA
jgi:hypothetical protein